MLRLSVRQSRRGEEGKRPFRQGAGETEGGKNMNISFVVSTTLKEGCHAHEGVLKEKEKRTHRRKKSLLKMFENKKIKKIKKNIKKKMKKRTETNDEK